LKTLLLAKSLPSRRVLAAAGLLTIALAVVASAPGLLGSQVSKAITDLGKAQPLWLWVAGACFALAVVLPIWPRHSLAAPNTAVATNDFLNSIGVVTTFPDRGQPLARTIEMLRYCGFRWVRAGIEGLSDKGPTTIQTFLDAAELGIGEWWD